MSAQRLPVHGNANQLEQARDKEFLGFGVVLIILQSSFTTLMQNAISNDMMGRVGSIFTVFMLTANVLSLLIAGILGTLIGIRQVFFLLSGLMALSGLAAILSLRQENGQNEDKM